MGAGGGQRGGGILRGGLELERKVMREVHEGATSVFGWTARSKGR